MNANNQLPVPSSPPVCASPVCASPVCASPVCASPVCDAILQPITPWAPPRIRRINTILNEDLDNTEEYDEYSRRIDSLVFPEMELELEDEDEDAMDIVPNPNITLFRGNPEYSDDELDLESEDDDRTYIEHLEYDENAMELEDDSTIVLY